MLIVFLSCLFLSIQNFDINGLLFRVHGKLFIKLDQCIPQSGIFTLSEAERSVITFKRCIDKECNDCEDSITFVFQYKAFTTFPSFDFFSKFINARVLGSGNADKLSRNGHATLFFNDFASCESMDLAKVGTIIFSYEDSTFLKCLNTNIFTRGESSRKCECDPETKELVCRIFNTSSICEGNNYIDPSQDCRSDRFQKIRNVCGDFDLSRITDGITVDMSRDYYQKPNQFVGGKSECFKTSFSEKEMIFEVCDQSCETQCEVSFQNYVLGENVPIENLNVYLTNPYGGSLYVYNDKPLEMKHGYKNFQDYYDLAHIINNNGDIEYFYSYPKFEWCQDDEKYECNEKDGSVTVITHCSDNETSSSPTRKVDKSMSCGRLPVDNGDITYSLPDAVILVIIFGAILGFVCGSIFLCCCLLFFCLCCTVVVFGEDAKYSFDKWSNTILEGFKSPSGGGIDDDDDDRFREEDEREYNELLLMGSIQSGIIEDENEDEMVDVEEVGNSIQDLEISAGSGLEDMKEDFEI